MLHLDVEVGTGRIAQSVLEDTHITRLPVFPALPGNGVGTGDAQGTHHTLEWHLVSDNFRQLSRLDSNRHFVGKSQLKLHWTSADDAPTVEVLGGSHVDLPDTIAVCPGAEKAVDSCIHLVREQDGTIQDTILLGNSAEVGIVAVTKHRLAFRQGTNLVIENRSQTGHAASPRSVLLGYMLQVLWKNKPSPIALTMNWRYLVLVWADRVEILDFV